MKKGRFNFIGISVLALILSISFGACSPIDKDYGVSSKPEETAAKQIELPAIKSDDTVMPLYFDISRYDEEDYSQIYLGKKYKYKMTYGGSEIVLPSSYDAMRKKGWELLDSETYSGSSIIKAGETFETQVVNEYGKQLSVSFYNDGNSSVKLSKCPIVRFSVKENSALLTESVYDQFWINGVSNYSAITDVIEMLGLPSHFEAKDNGIYRLDYFLTKEDRRSRITVFINVNDDCVTAIEASRY